MRFHRKQTGLLTSNAASARADPIQGPDHALKATLRTGRLIRFAQCAALGLLAAPALTFWFLLFLERYIPDVTLRELLRVPFARECIIAWTLGVAVVVAMVTDPAADATQHGQAARR